MTVIIERTAGYDVANAVDITDAAVATMAAVKAQAMAHVATGNYLQGISLEREQVEGVTHHIVMVDDENVYAIEWGHFPRGQYNSGKRVPGQFVLTNAYRQMAGG